MDAVRAATTAPFGVNLFVVEPYEPDAASLDAYRRSLEPEAARLGAELGEARWEDDHWQAKVDLVLDSRPDVVSFTFGCPSAEVLRRMADRGVLSSVTVTSVAEARVAVAHGAASLCVQGPHAGGHRGTWRQEADPDTTPLARPGFRSRRGGRRTGSGRRRHLRPGRRAVPHREGRSRGTDRDRVPARGGGRNERDTSNGTRGTRGSPRPPSPGRTRAGGHAAWPTGSWPTTPTPRRAIPISTTSRPRSGERPPSRATCRSPTCGQEPATPTPVPPAAADLTRSLVP